MVQMVQNYSVVHEAYTVLLTASLVGALAVNRLTPDNQTSHTKRHYLSPVSSLNRILTSGLARPVVIDIVTA